ncbi:MAG: AAA family ATPase [Desulfobacteraceae bacterium]|nr:AAA family ATPase [Desulfobacteraceae bacterium]
MMIREYLTAGYPALYFLTQEPHRAEEMLGEEAKDKCVPFAWDCNRGIRKAGSLKVEEALLDFVQAASWLNEQTDTILFAHNLHRFMDVPEYIQAIQNGVQLWKSRGNCLCVIAPVLTLPPELEKFFFAIDFPLPDETRLAQIQTELSQTDGIYVETNPAATLAAKGLTEFEAETAYAYALATKGAFDPRVISSAKAQMIKKSGFLEFKAPEDPQLLGGLGRFKKWLAPRLEAFTPQSTLPRIRALLFAGVPGTGKSLTAKCLANMIGWDLIRMDLTGMKDQYVGESERKTRLACQIIEAFGRCVVWLDEIEKILGGSGQAAQGDVSASMLSILLTFMQETKAEVLLACTANRAYTLPGELLRRFNEIWFVDTPTLSERIEIIEIMNRKWKANIPIELASKLEGYTGAEIEKLTEASFFESPESALKRIVPVTKSSKEDVDRIRQWAAGGASPANTPEEESVSETTRRLKL